MVLFFHSSPLSSFLVDCALFWCSIPYIFWKLLFQQSIWSIWRPFMCILWSVRFFVTFWESTGSISWNLVQRVNERLSHTDELALPICLLVLKTNHHHVKQNQTIILITTGICIWKCEKALIGLLAPRFNISAIKGTSAVGLGRNFQPFLQPHFHLFFLTSYFHSYLFLCHDFFDKILIFFILLSVLAMWMGPSIWVHLPMFLQTTSLHTRTPFPTNWEGFWGKWR